MNGGREAVGYSCHMFRTLCSHGRCARGHCSVWFEAFDMLGRDHLDGEFRQPRDIGQDAFEKEGARRPHLAHWLALHLCCAFAGISGGKAHAQRPNDPAPSRYGPGPGIHVGFRYPRDGALWQRKFRARDHAIRGSAQAQRAPERNMAVSSVLLCNHVLALRHSHMSSKRSKVKKAGSFSL